jgi:hypothetical protein
MFVLNLLSTFGGKIRGLGAQWNASAFTFCAIPFSLAEATIGIIEEGADKLTREKVMEICKKAVSA